MEGPTIRYTRREQLPEADRKVVFKLFFDKITFKFIFKFIFNF